MIRNLENSEKIRQKQEVLGFFIPKSICQNSYEKVNILMKTKNAPNDLKCKINHTFFLETGVPKRGGGGGGGAPPWEKFHLGWRPLGHLPFLFVFFAIVHLIFELLKFLVLEGQKHRHISIIYEDTDSILAEPIQVVPHGS